jgi:copper transport protein
VVRLLAAIALMLAAAGGLAARAEAHATLESTTPERGAALERAPGEVVLRFSEPVEIAFGAVQVFDSGGAQVAQGDAYHPGGGSSVAVRLPRDLPRGGYTVTFRVISADAHPVSGGFTFGVGAGAAAPATGVADLLSGQEAGPVTSVAFSVVRALQFGAITLGLGLLAVLLAAWLPALRSSAAWDPGAAAFRGRAELLLLAAAAAGAGSALLGLGLQTAVAGGTSLWSALGDAGTILETRFGIVWGLGALVWAFVLVAVTMARATAQRRVPRIAGGAAGAPRRRCWRWRCCQGSAGMPECRSRSRCCCRPTSCTCSPRAPGSAASRRS